MAFSSFENVSSDYRIVSAKISLNPRNNKTQTTKATYYDWFLLNNRDIRDKYTITPRNIFDALQEIFETLTPNDEIENLVHTQMKAVAECIPN